MNWNIDYDTFVTYFINLLLSTGVCYSFVILSAINKFYDMVPTKGSDLAYGFADSGNAIGMICLPVLTAYFKEVYGWRGAILLLAGIGSHLSVFIMLMKEPSITRAADERPESRYEEEPTMGDDLTPLLLHSPAIDAQRDSEEDQNIYDSKITHPQNTYIHRGELSDQSVEVQRPQTSSSTASGEPMQYSAGTQNTERACPSEKLRSKSVEEDAKSLTDHENVTNTIVVTPENISNLKDDGVHHLSDPADCIDHDDEQGENELNAHLNGLNDTLSRCCTKILRFISDALGLRLLITKPSLITLYLYYLMSGVITTAWVVFLIPHGVSKGFPLSRAVYLASFGGIGNVIGRIAQGPIIHKRWLSSIDLTIILGTVNAIVFLVDPLVHRFAILAVNAFIGGLTLGARTTLFVVILKQFIPKDQFSTGIGFSCFFNSIGEPLGGLLAGKIMIIIICLLYSCPCTASHFIENHTLNRWYTSRGGARVFA